MSEKGKKPVIRLQQMEVTLKILSEQSGSPMTPLKTETPICCMLNQETIPYRVSNSE